MGKNRNRLNAHMNNVHTVTEPTAPVVTDSVVTEPTTETVTDTVGDVLGTGGETPVQTPTLSVVPVTPYQSFNLSAAIRTALQTHGADCPRDVVLAYCAEQSGQSVDDLKTPTFANTLSVLRKKISGGEPTGTHKAPISTVSLNDCINLCKNLGHSPKALVALLTAIQDVGSVTAIKSRLEEAIAIAEMMNQKITVAHIETYLPVGSVVTVLARNADKAVNYTTSKEVVVTESTYQPCPLGLMTQTYSGTWLRDHKTVVQGVTIWFTPRQLRRRIVVPTTDVVSDVYTHPLSKIDFDIPSALGPGYRDNVNTVFHSLGIKFSNTAWVMRSGDIPLNLIAAMEEDGCNVNVHKLDKSEIQKVISQAIISLQTQIEEHLQRANQSLESAVNRMNNADENASEEEIIKKALREAKVLEKRYEEYTKEMLPGANRIGITDAAWNPQRLPVAAKAMSSDLRRRAAAYRKGVKAMQASTDATVKALVPDAVTSTLPVHVMGDALREAGDEKAADELNEVFSLIDGTGD
ncbi:unnamed protein product [Sphagnum balticum]